MTKRKSNPKPNSTGTAVRDVKAATDKPSVPDENRVQIHQGNIPVVTLQLMSEVVRKLDRIAIALERANG